MAKVITTQDAAFTAFTQATQHAQSRAQAAEAERAATEAARLALPTQVQAITGPAVQAAQAAASLAVQRAGVVGSVANDADLAGRAAGDYRVGLEIVSWNGNAVTARTAVLASDADVQEAQALAQQADSKAGTASDLAATTQYASIAAMSAAPRTPAEAYRTAEGRRWRWVDGTLTSPNRRVAALPTGYWEIDTIDATVRLEDWGLRPALDGAFPNASPVETAAVGSLTKRAALVFPAGSFPHGAEVALGVHVAGMHGAGPEVTRLSPLNTLDVLFRGAGVVGTGAYSRVKVSSLSLEGESRTNYGYFSALNSFSVFEDLEISGFLTVGIASPGWCNTFRNLWIHGNGTGIEMYGVADSSNAVTLDAVRLDRNTVGLRLGDGMTATLSGGSIGERHGEAVALLANFRGFTARDYYDERNGTAGRLYTDSLNTAGTRVHASFHLAGGGDTGTVLSFNPAKLCDGATFDGITWTPLNTGGLNDSPGATANPENHCLVFSNGPSNVTINNVSIYPGSAHGPVLGIWGNGNVCEVKGRNTLRGSGAGPGSVGLIGPMGILLPRGGHKIDAGFTSRNYFPVPTEATQVLETGVPVALVSGADAYDAGTPTYEITAGSEQYALTIPADHPLRGKTVTFRALVKSPAGTGVQLMAVDSVARTDRTDEAVTGDGTWQEISFLYRVPATGSCYIAFRRRGGAGQVLIARVHLAEAGAQV